MSWINLADGSLTRIRTSQDQPGVRVDATRPAVTAAGSFSARGDPWVCAGPESELSPGARTRLFPPHELHAPVRFDVDIGDISISMANTVYVGLAVTSHDRHHADHCSLRQRRSELEYAGCRIRDRGVVIVT